MNKSIGKQSTEIQRIYAWSFWNAIKQASKGDPATLKRNISIGNKELEGLGFDKEIIESARREHEELRNSGELDAIRSEAEIIRDEFN